MPQHPACGACNAGKPDLQGICTDCDGCMSQHCQCDPCQHGKARSEECVFCERPSALADVMVNTDALQDDIDWLFEP
jgi:hypothetical protein